VSILSSVSRNTPWLKTGFAALKADLVIFANNVPGFDF
jgi:hypothetical protein